MAESKNVKKLSAAILAKFNRTDNVKVAPAKKSYPPLLNEKPLKKNYPPLLNEKPLPDNPIFHSPMVLVSTVDGKPTCDQSTLSKLREIEQPLNIVSIVGTLRTGKSLLFNKLASHVSVGNKSYFEIGHTTDPVTKGIWVMCRPHPIKENEVLVLLDTEGIDDPDKVDVEDDKNVFILATLLSNTLVYNTRGNIEKATIDKFKFLERLKTSITVNGSEEDDSILDFFFPNFVLTLRDVTLNTKAKDDDAFLEEKLILSRDKNANKEALEEYNLPRKLIRRYFKQRKCFRFIQPIETNRLKELMTLDESTLEKEFKQKLDEFRSHIFSCKPKSLKSGKAINGRMFCTLVLNYVHSIRAGDPPCLISAMVSMAAVENTYVSKRASEIYKAEMQRRIASHIPSEKGLVNYHKDCMCAALEVLKDGLIIDDQQIYEEQAIACFEDQLEKFKIIVKKHTDSECWELLERIDRMKIQLKIKNRKYCTPTGYDDYMADIDSLIKQFNREAGYMGSVAMSALQDFLAKKSTEEEEVYKLVQDALNGKEGPERRNMKSLLREDDAKIQKEEEKIEEAIRADIEMLQKDGQQSIGEQYFDMLTSKIEEVDRVKNELGRNNLHYKNLCKETAHWKNVFENAPFSLSHYRRQLKPVGGQQADMQATVTEEQRASPEGTEAIEDYSDSSQSCGHNKQDVKEQTKCKIL